MSWGISRIDFHTGGFASFSGQDTKNLILNIGQVELRINVDPRFILVRDDRVCRRSPGGYSGQGMFEPMKFLGDDKYKEMAFSTYGKLVYAVDDDGTKDYGTHSKIWHTFRSLENLAWHCLNAYVNKDDLYVSIPGSTDKPRDMDDHALGPVCWLGVTGPAYQFSMTALDIFQYGLFQMNRVLSAALRVSWEQLGAIPSYNITRIAGIMRGLRE